MPWALPSGRALPSLPSFGFDALNRSRINSQPFLREPGPPCLRASTLPPHRRNFSHRYTRHDNVIDRGVSWRVPARSYGQANGSFWRSRMPRAISAVSSSFSPTVGLVRHATVPLADPKERAPCEGAVFPSTVLTWEPSDCAHHPTLNGLELPNRTSDLASRIAVSGRGRAREPSASTSRPRTRQPKRPRMSRRARRPGCRGRRPSLP